MMHRAVVVPATEDLRPFILLLQQRQLPSHVTEESGELVIWARSEAEAAVLAGLFADWRAGEIEMSETAEDSLAYRIPRSSPGQRFQGFIAAARLAPFTMLLIAACLLVALLSQIGSNPDAVRFLFFPYIPLDGLSPIIALFSGIDSLSAALRTLSPVLLHFGPVHLVFNLLWLWYFGRMMEPELGLRRYVPAMVFMAFCGNALQYLWSGHGNFGGMSGVVYGQIGLIWMWQTLRPWSAMRLPTAMIMVFLVALVLMEVVASSLIATAAHIGGLVGGMLAGLWLGFSGPGRKRTYS
jgi:GlpG protein